MTKQFQLDGIVLLALCCAVAVMLFPLPSSGAEGPPAEQEEGEHHCPKPNEVWLDCAQGGLCQPSCAGPRRFCPMIACMPTMGACGCKDGFVREASADGLCIPKTQCPPQEQHQCPKPNEVWLDCAHGGLCQPSCAGPRRFCPRIACTPTMGACGCKEGFVREPSSSGSGQCIPKTQCPPAKPTDD